MPEELLVLIMMICLVGVLLLAVYLLMSLFKRYKLKQLYAGSNRDFRFVCELLRLFVGKEQILKNPCLLRSYGEIPPRADVLVIGGGGLLILSAVDAPGQYTTPVSGSWSIWRDGEVTQIPNAFSAGRQYTSVLSGILVKCGLSCPVVNVVVLTDDHAKADALHGENILTGNQLVPFVKEFCSHRALGRKGQEKVRTAIWKHHEICQRQLASSMAEKPEAEYSDLLAGVHAESVSEETSETKLKEASGKSAQTDLTQEADELQIIDELLTKVNLSEDEALVGNSAEKHRREGIKGISDIVNDWFAADEEPDELDGVPNSEETEDRANDSSDCIG